MSYVGDFKSFLTIVEGFTKGTWVYLLKSNEEACNYVSSFLNLISNQFSTETKMVRSDNGIELLNHKMKIFLNQKVFFIGFLVFIIHNKMLLWRENIGMF